MTIKTLFPEQNGTPYSLEQWLEKREDIKMRFFDNIGMPEFSRNTRAIETIETTNCENYEMHKLRYIVGENEEIHAYLLVPTGAIAPGPAIVAMHQWNDFGKDEVVGLNGFKDFAYGHELATQGYVILAPDCLTFGERVYPGKKMFDPAPFYEKYPNWSMVGKDVEDSMSAIDVL